MIGQIRVTNWQWVFFGGIAALLIMDLIILAARVLSGSSPLWLSDLAMFLMGLSWLLSGLIIILNWRGGLDATIQQGQELRRRRGKDPDTFNWGLYRAFWRVLAVFLIVFGLFFAAISISMLT